MGLFSRAKKLEISRPAQELGSLSVIALANSTHAVESIFSSLIKYEYKTKLVFDIPSFIDALEDFNPDIILVSLNLRNTETLKVITLLQNLDLPVIVFGEEEDEQTCLRLLSTDLRHVIIPPVTFESFMERVEFLAMEKELMPADVSPAVQNIEGPAKNNWGRVIQLLNEKILNLGNVIINNEPGKTSGEVDLQEATLTEAHFDELTIAEETDLQIGKILAADIFIAMPLNHKCILYLRSGCLLTKENMDRLHRYGRSRVMKRR